jgi:phosphoribosylformylglycinamidine synthase
MASMRGNAHVGVIQFPGVNCEYETARALEAAGLDAEVIRWNDAGGRALDGIVLPGGWSYQDRVRGGAIAAREPVLDTVRELAAAGKPVLGICNGAQVLVEAGLVPGDGESAGPHLCLARNDRADRDGYYVNWVELVVGDAACAFTHGVAPGTVIPMPVAHGEGRFATIDESVATALRDGTHVAFRYGAGHDGIPGNPNGSIADVAGVAGGAAGNVLALMPHPERGAWLWQVPAGFPGEWGERRRTWRSGTEKGSDAMRAAGPGHVIFESMARYLEAM